MREKPRHGAGADAPSRGRAAALRYAEPPGRISKTPSKLRDPHISPTGGPATSARLTRRGPRPRSAKKRLPDSRCGRAGRPRARRAAAPSTRVGGAGPEGKLQIFGKISANFRSFSAVSAPIFASKDALFSTFQNLPDYLTEHFEILQILQIFN